MSKDQIVSDAKASLVSGQDSVLSQVLGSVYDLAAAEQKGADGTFGQADIDAAVAAAVGPLNQQISDLSAQDALDKQAAIDAKAAGDQAVSDLQKQLSDLQSAKGIEDGVISGLQASISSIQGALAALQGLFPPAP